MLASLIGMTVSGLARGANGQVRVARESTTPLTSPGTGYEPRSQGQGVHARLAPHVSLWPLGPVLWRRWVGEKPRTSRRGTADTIARVHIIDLCSVV
eukprot:6176988-Pleurochrysis_carterae.AAC.6